MATKKQKKFHYVLVFTEHGPVYVTSIGEHHVAYWDKLQVPCEVSEDLAKDIVVGLAWNGFNAVIVQFPCEIVSQPYAYDFGSLEWKNN